MLNFEIIKGGNKAFNLSYEDVMPLIPDKYYDWAVCDIPYGIGVAKMAYLKETNTVVKQKNGNKLNPFTNKKKYAFKDWDSATPPSIS